MDCNGERGESTKGAFLSSSAGRRQRGGGRRGAVAAAAAEPARGTVGSPRVAPTRRRHESLTLDLFFVTVKSIAAQTWPKVF